MASLNPFDLLGDDAEDPSQQIVAEQLKVVTSAPKKNLPQPQLPIKPLPPSQAVREARNETSRGVRGGGRGSGRGRGRGRGGFGNGEAAERRVFEHRSGTGRGTTEEMNETAKNFRDEKPSGADDIVADGNKENPANEAEEKEPEDKEMTLEEYEKVLEERRKAFQALKTEERKVDPKVFESMQQLSNKKDNDDIFIKLGSDKDKRKETLEKEERSKKCVSINEFLKPPEGESYYNTGGRGRGRGGGGRGLGGRGGYDDYATANIPAPSIEDPRQFPTLGVK